MYLLPAMPFVDSHTEGEPTRVVFDGLPHAPHAAARERITGLLAEHPKLRAAIVDEPRGYPALVAALLLPAPRPELAATVAFLNNVALLPMCVHASIGIARTLIHLGRADAQPWSTPIVLETVAGEVELLLEADDVIAVTSVPAYRMQAKLELPSAYGPIHADLAWGGNWFAIVEQPPIPVAPAHIDALMALTKQLRASLEAAGVRGDDGAAIDHIQLCGPSEQADACNFVLCPGGEFDRSPCGTGTAARMACLHADGRLALGQRWRQQGIMGSCFVGEVGASLPGGRIRPIIRGRAWVTAEGRLLFDPTDPLA